MMPFDEQILKNTQTDMQSATPSDSPADSTPIHSPPRRTLSPMAAALIAAFPGMLFFPIALVFDPLVHKYFDTDPAFINYSNDRIFYFTLFFLMWGVVSVGGGILAGRLGLGRWLARHPLVLSALFSLHLVFVLLVTADGALGVRGTTPAIPYITYNHWKYFYRAIPAFDRLAYGNNLTYDAPRRKITPADLPPPGTKRIIFMGDSVVYGDRIPAHQSLPWVFDKRLGPEFEVINAGILGYDFHHYYYYAHDLVRLKPDLVILGICLNDFGNVSDTRLAGNPKDPDCAIQKVTWYNTIRWWANQHSGLMNIDRAFYKYYFPKNNQEIARAVVKRMTDMLDNEALLQHKIDESRPYVRELANLLREHHIPFAAVVFPFQFQYEDIMDVAFPHHTDLQAAVVELCEENGIPVLDVREPLQQVVNEHGLRPFDIFLDYNHFNPRGCEEVADAILPWVRELMAGQERPQENHPQP